LNQGLTLKKKEIESCFGIGSLFHYGLSIPALGNGFGKEKQDPIGLCLRGWFVSLVRNSLD
jgi:hypothetical protein